MTRRSAIRVGGGCCLSRGYHGQQKIGWALTAGVERICAGKQCRWTVDRVVVREPGDPPKRASCAGPLEILALDCQRQPRSRGQRESHGPDLKVNLVDFTRRERLSFIMRIIWKVFR